MDAFLYSTTWRYQLFGQTAGGYVWRIWFDGNGPLIQRLIGNEHEFAEPLGILRAMEEQESETALKAGQPAEVREDDKR